MATAIRAAVQTDPPAQRVSRLDWASLETQLDALGYGTTGPLLTTDECRALARLYDDHDRFRSRIVMQRHAYGQGEYQYFRYPLPKLVAELRAAAYPKLAPIANRWQAALGQEASYPDRLESFLTTCHDAGRPAQHHCSCDTVPAITIDCTRIFMVRSTFLYRWQSC